MLGLVLGESLTSFSGRGGKDLLISLTFFSKWVTKSSGERHAGGVGGGGLRRVEKVEKSFLGLEVQDWILVW